MAATKAVASDSSLHCQRCGKSGHRAVNCSRPFFRAGHAVPGVGGAHVSATVQRRSPHRDVECYECGEVGHVRADCPRRVAVNAATAEKLRRRALRLPAEALPKDWEQKLEMIRDVYRDLDSGFSIGDDERAAVNDVGGSDVYGELLPIATLELLDALALQPRDVFFDLGCGTGKVLAVAGLCSQAGRIVGLELVKTRVDSAAEAIKRLGLESRCEALMEDFLISPCLEDATVCYGCNYTLPERSFSDLLLRLARLPRLRLLVTMKPPYNSLSKADADTFSAAFRPAGTLRLDCSWSGCIKTFLYRRRS